MRILLVLKVLIFVKAHKYFHPARRIARPAESFTPRMKGFSAMRLRAVPSLCGIIGTVGTRRDKRGKPGSVEVGLAENVPPEKPPAVCTAASRENPNQGKEAPQRKRLRRMRRRTRDRAVEACPRPVDRGSLHKRAGAKSGAGKKRPRKSAPPGQPPCGAVPAAKTCQDWGKSPFPGGGRSEKRRCNRNFTSGNRNATANWWRLPSLHGRLGA